MESSNEAVTITASELRRVTSQVLDHLANELGDTIDLGADHYWLIEPSAETCAYYNTDTTFDPVLTAQRDHAADGQSSPEFVEIVCQLAVADHVSVWHELGHLLGVLQRLAALARP